MPELEAAHSYWVNIGGYALYLYLPVGWQPNGRWPICLGLPAEMLSCHDWAEQWRPAADRLGFVLLCPDGIQDMVALQNLTYRIPSLLMELEYYFATAVDWTLLAGHGQGATAALDWALFGALELRYAVCFEGALPADWETRMPELQPGAAVYVGLSASHPLYAETESALDTLAGDGVASQFVTCVDGLPACLPAQAADWILAQRST